MAARPNLGAGPCLLHNDMLDGSLVIARDPSQGGTRSRTDGVGWDQGPPERHTDYVLSPMARHGLDRQVRVVFVRLVLSSHCLTMCSFSRQ